MPKKKSKSKKHIDTTMHITLPTPEGGGYAPDRRTGTLLMQQGDYAYVHQFDYTGLWSQVQDAMRYAHAQLHILMQAPPTLTTAPDEKPSDATQDNAPDEPTIDIPRKKGKHTIPMSHLKIVAGETDAVAYRIAMQIAGRLLDGGLWDGKQPLRLKHVGDILQRIKAFTDKDFSLFTLADFAEVDDQTQNLDTE
jgi:hypothetical protein